MTTNSPQIKNLDQIFPVCYNAAKAELIEILTISTKWAVEVLIQAVRDKVKIQDEQREKLYLSGAYGRLAIVEWSPEYNNTPQWEKELDTLRDMIGS